MKDLFESPRVEKLQMSNRLVKSATWLGLADRSGAFGKDVLKTYEDWASGGVGAIITGFTDVAEFLSDMKGVSRICDDSLIPCHAALVDTVHAYNIPVLAQLGFSGLVGKKRLPVPIDDVTLDDIELVESRFEEAAVRAAAAGYDGVQIHACHFFFLSKFVSPAENHRTDAYGGSNENRGRIVTEIITRVREAVPDLHLSLKMNCSDFMDGGLSFDDALELAKLYCACGLDSIEVSGNGTSQRSVRPGKQEGYFYPFAMVLSLSVDTPVICVGGWRSRKRMEECLNDANVEMLSLARPIICEPDFPNLLKQGKAKTSVCTSCNRCYMNKGHTCSLSHMI